MIDNYLNISAQELSVGINNSYYDSIIINPANRYR